MQPSDVVKSGHFQENKYSQDEVKARVHQRALPQRDKNPCLAKKKKDVREGALPKSTQAAEKPYHLLVVENVVDEDQVGPPFLFAKCDLDRHNIFPKWARTEVWHEKQ